MNVAISDSGKLFSKCAFVWVIYFSAKMGHLLNGHVQLWGGCPTTGHHQDGNYAYLKGQIVLFSDILALGLS